MYVEKLKNGNFKFFEFYYDILGKRKKVAITLSSNNKENRKIAQNYLKEKIYKKIEKEEKEKNKEYLISSLLDEFFEYKKTYLKETSLYILNNIISILKIEFKNIYINNLNTNIIYKKFNLSTKNLKYKYMYFKNFIKWCYSRDYINDIQFMERVDFKNIEKKYNKNKLEKKLYLEKSELEDILNFFENSFIYPIIKIQVNTGLRIGELLALTFKDINENEININKIIYNKKLYNFTKTNTSKRKIIINNELKNFIKKMEKTSKNKNFLFLTKKNDFFSCSRIDIELKKYKKIKLSSHIFRHTHASLLIEKGIPIDVISRRLGHNDIKITKEIYIHLTKKMKEKENEIFKKIIIV